MKTVKITGNTYEPISEDNRWCKHCGWADFGHVVGAATGRLLCKADEPKPPPPDVLGNALQEIVHEDSGDSRPAHAVRASSNGNG